MSARNEARTPTIGWRNASSAVLLALAFAAGPAAGAALAEDPVASPSASPDPIASPPPSASPTPSPTASPTPTPRPSPAVRVSQYPSGDYVRQYTIYQCVGASIQMMINVGRTVDSHSSWWQRVYWNRARRRSLYKADGGADPFGWAGALAVSRGGPYRVVGAATMSEAVGIAARAMALTGRPAGMIVWRGRHAWVMTGFGASADPAVTEAFDVLTVRISDPLWPYFHVRRRTIYRPNTELWLDSLARNLTPYHDPRYDPRIEGRYVVIIPVPMVPAPTAEPVPSPTPAPASAPDPSPSPDAPPTADATPTPDEASTPTPEPSPSLTPEPSPSPTPTPEPSPSLTPGPDA